MSRIFNAISIFCSSLIILVLEEKFGVISQVSIFIFKSYGTDVAPLLNSLLIAILSEIINKIAKGLRANIRINYFDEKGQNITDKKIHFSSYEDGGTSDISIKVELKYSKYLDYLFKKTGTYLYIYINPRIGNFELKNGYLSNNREGLDKIEGGIKYYFTERFEPTGESANLRIDLVYQCFTSGGAKMHVCLKSENKLATLILPKLCKIEAQKLSIRSEVG